MRQSHRICQLAAGRGVVDLGSGGGLDAFLAAKAVGPTGKAIGIDMTPEMIELARRNAVNSGGGDPPENVEFHLATIDKLPLAEASVDCIISNCVINLAPDKPQVFAEMARVLKPGGRVAISDIAIKKPLPEELGENLLAYVGCIAGAIEIGGTAGVFRRRGSRRSRFRTAAPTSTRTRPSKGRAAAARRAWSRPTACRC